MLTNVAGIVSEITFFTFAAKSGTICPSVAKEDGKKGKKCWELAKGERPRLHGTVVRAEPRELSMTRPQAPVKDIVSLTDLEIPSSV